MKKNINFNTLIVFLIISILSLIFVSCSQDPSTLRTYQPPEYIDDGLETGSLEEVNIDQTLIEKAVNDISRGKYKEVHSMLIFKDDKLVVEEYFTGHKYQWDAPSHHGELITWNRDMLHNIASDTKSITSTCIGIAIDKGFIESVNQSIFDYLPEYQHLNTDGKDKISIEHLLTMTSGLEWDEWNASLSSPSNDTIGIWFSDKDPVTFVLERPLIYEPGTNFTYSGGNMTILGEILRNASGMNLDEFSTQYLFEPLGIKSSLWLQFENGVIAADGQLKIKPRDMAKIGVMFLNNGLWNGKQIVSGEWVEKSTISYPGNTKIKIPGTDSGVNGYSYTWWTKEYSLSGKEVNMYYAGGWGGQYIMVFPELDTVVVFTGGNYTSKIKNFGFLEKYILPAVE